MGTSVSLAEEPRYETLVHGETTLETQPDDDPAGFASVLRLRQAPPGVNLAQLLERAPGLRVKDAGPAGRQTVSLRGADGRQVAVFLDGVRLTPASGGGVDLSLLDPANLDSAEIRRGASSARFGADALGGAVLLRTPRLTDRPKTRVGVGYGSWNSLAVSGARAAALGGCRYLLGGAYHQSDGDFPYVDDNGVTRRRANNDSRTGAVMAKLDRRLGERWQVGLLDDFSVADRGAPGMSQRPSETARQQDLQNVTSLRFSRFDALLSRGRFDLMLAHRYSRFRFDELTPPLVHSHSQSFSLEGTARLGLPLARVGRLDAGLETRGSLYRDPAAGDPSRLEVDAWASASARLFGRRLVLVPAVRLASSTDFGATVVPRAGLVLRPLRGIGWPPAARLELIANLGRSFRYPSFQEMYTRLDGFGGNADLRPEDALDGDVGLRWSSALLSLEGVYFRRWISNLILFAPVSSFLVRADNYRGALAHGAELSAAAYPARGLSVRASYTLTRTRFGEPEMALPGHPEHRLKARLDWSSSLGSTADGSRPARWAPALWAEVTAQSAMALSRFNTTEEEGRVLLGVGASLSHRGLTLSAAGENLLDKRDAVDAVGFPLPPARFLVSLAAAL